jgi:hypothetical protein
MSILCPLSKNGQPSAALNIAGVTVIEWALGREREWHIDVNLLHVQRFTSIPELLRA